MTKQDLKTGQRVQYRNGSRRIVIKTDFMVYLFVDADEKYMDFTAYREDLLCEGNEEFDIMKVYNPPSAPYRMLTASQVGNLVWEREEVPEYTMEEAISRMGHEFKIKK